MDTDSSGSESDSSSSSSSTNADTKYCPEEELKNKKVLKQTVVMGKKEITAPQEPSGNQVPSELYTCGVTYHLWV